jgi:inorganic triphosphatase YgiF
MSRETELKFLVDSGFQIPDLKKAGLGIGSVVELPAQSLSAIYYDTEDLRLARSGVTLRHRAGNGAERPWTLKLPITGEESSREELTYEASPKEPPAEAKALVTAFIRGNGLRPVTRIQTKRRRWSLMARGKQLGELVDDHVSVLNGAVVVNRFREIEIELQGLNGASLKKIDAFMRRAGAGPADPTPKAIRALGDRARKPADIAEPAPPSPGAPAFEAVKTALASAAHRLIVHDATARLGDAEGVHQMRVAVRRLAATCACFRRYSTRSGRIAFAKN